MIHLATSVRPIVILGVELLFLIAWTIFILSRDDGRTKEHFALPEKSPHRNRNKNGIEWDDPHENKDQDNAVSTPDQNHLGMRKPEE